MNEENKIIQEIDIEKEFVEVEREIEL